MEHLISIIYLCEVIVFVHVLFACLIFIFFQYNLISAIPIFQVVMLVFLLMVAVSILIWIGAGKNPIDSTAVARV